MSTVPQKMGVIMATIIGMNAMIGAGIFGVPSGLIVSVGPAGLLTYALVIIGVWLMALALARVAQRYPHEGAFYTYASQWGGHTAGILTSVCYTIGLIIALGLLTRITGIYLQAYIPAAHPVTLGVSALWLLTLLNMAGAVLSQVGQVVLIVLTLIPLFIITGLCLTKVSFSNLFPFVPHGFSNIFTATKVVVFGFFGFEAIPSLCTAIENPQKNVPRAVTYSIVLTGLIYFAFVASIILGLPHELFTSAETPLAQVLLSVFPDYQWLVTIIHAAITITIMGTIHAMVWALSALSVALANRTELLRNKISQRLALVGIGTAVTAACITFTSIDLFFALTAVFITMAYASSIASLLVKHKDQTKSDRMLAFCGIFTALIIAACAMDTVIKALS